MISSEYTVPVQLTSSNLNGALYSGNYFESVETCQNGDYNKGRLMNRGLDDYLEPSTSYVANDAHLENNSLESYHQDQNYNVNIAFHMSPIIQANTMPPPLYSPYENGGNNNNSVVKNYNKRNDWNNYLNYSVTHQGYESDESSTSHSSSNTQQEGARPKMARNGYRFSYESLNAYNRNGNQLAAQTNQHFRNVTSYNQHRNVNGLSKSRYCGNNCKRSRRNHSKYHHSDDLTRRVHGLMERFKSKAKYFQISSVPPTYGTTQISQLDMSIWNLFHSKAQTQETYFRKVELWKKLYVHIGKLFDRYGLFMVGSTMSGLGIETSDIDMCLLIRSTLGDTRSEAVRCLEIIRNSLQNSDFVESPEVIHAKVPILKFRGSEHGFEVDLNCNNAVGIRNTHLLNCYTQLDWRVRPLAVVVKLWAQANSINDAKNMTISSYSLALMVIHYLQCGVVPPVLPCLHGLYHDKFNPEREIHDIDIQEELPKFVSDNKQTLGELLSGFLQYYAYFPFETDAISVRLATCISVNNCRLVRSQKNDPHQWKYLCIEEPFDSTNTARSVYDLQTFKRIQRVFSDSSTVLRQTNNLNSILRSTEGNNQR